MGITLRHSLRLVAAAAGSLCWQCFAIEESRRHDNAFGAKTGEHGRVTRCTAVTLDVLGCRQCDERCLSAICRSHLDYFRRQHDARNERGTG